MQVGLINKEYIKMWLFNISLKAKLVLMIYVEKLLLRHMVQFLEFFYET